MEVVFRTTSAVKTGEVIGAVVLEEEEEEEDEEDEYDEDDEEEDEEDEAIEPSDS